MDGAAFCAAGAAGARLPVAGVPTGGARGEEEPADLKLEMLNIEPLLPALVAEKGTGPLVLVDELDD